MANHDYGEYDGPFIEKRIEWKSPSRKRYKAILFGSWNRFKGEDQLEYQGKQIYACNVKLPLGNYVYRFLINGEDWETHDNAEKTARNGIEYNQIRVTADNELEDDAQNTKLKIGADGKLCIDNRRKYKPKKRKHKKDESEDKEWAKYVFAQQLRLQNQHNDEINRVKTLWKQERQVRVEMHKKVAKQLKISKNETSILRDAAKTGKYDSLIKHYQLQISNLERDLETERTSLRKCINVKNEMNDKLLKSDTEKKEIEGDGLPHLLIMLNGELDVFKKNYNQQQLQQIMNENASKLTEIVNNDINSTSNVVKEIMSSCTLFAKQIEESKKIIIGLITPDISQYETWNISKIMSWILSLNGKYKQYENVLLNGFIESKITGKHLPMITRYDLSSPPFNIGSFEIKLELEKHFQSLLNISDAVLEPEAKVNENNNVNVVVNWNKSDIIEWINNIGLTEQWKESVLNVIKNGQYDGRDMMQIKSGKDIAKLFAIQNPMLCNRLWREFKKII